MKLTINRDKRSELEKLIDKQMDELIKLSETDDAYEGLMAELQKNLNLLNLRRTKVDVKDKKEGVNWTPIIVAAIGFIEILTIMKYERLHVITTKALSYVSRGRV